LVKITGTEDIALDLSVMDKGNTEKSAPAVIDENNLTSEEIRTIEMYEKQIDFANSRLIQQYGAVVQSNIADFSDSTIKNIRLKELGEIGDIIMDIVDELKGFSDIDKKGAFFGIFRKIKYRPAALMTKYEKAEAGIEKMRKALEKHQLVLMKDSAMLNKLYDENMEYYNKITLCIIAGKKRLEEAKNNELPILIKKYEASGLMQDKQAADDFSAILDLFEKKLYDLEISRAISMQMAPQIRLIQHNNSLMIDKMQSTIVNTIPLWKQQMVIAIGLQHTQEATRAQREVTDKTNEILENNARSLKSVAALSAKESRKGIVDIEALTETNRKLIKTLDEVLTIQNESREQRSEAEAELERVEDEMKNKIYTMDKEA